MFETIEDIELALLSVAKENKKIRDRPIKVFRNSNQQFQTYCDTNTIQKLSVDLRDERHNQLENLGEKLWTVGYFWHMQMDDFIMYRFLTWKIDEHSSSDAESLSQSDAESLSQSKAESECESLHVIHVENIPWTATKEQIVNLFAGINILNGKEGIHFIVDHLNHHNDAFIQLASLEDYEVAMSRKILRQNHFAVKSKCIFRNEWQLAQSSINGVGKLIIFCS